MPFESVRSFMTFLSVLVLALATLTVHVSAMTGEAEKTGTMMMADMEMSTGAAEPADCPPEMCAQMMDCALVSAPAAPSAPTSFTFLFTPSVEIISFDLSNTSTVKPVWANGIRRPPKLF